MRASTLLSSVDHVTKRSTNAAIRDADDSERADLRQERRGMPRRQGRRIRRTLLGARSTLRRDLAPSGVPSKPRSHVQDGVPTFRSFAHGRCQEDREEEGCSRPVEEGQEGQEVVLASPAISSSHRPFAVGRAERRRSSNTIQRERPSDRAPERDPTAYVFWQTHSFADDAHAEARSANPLCATSPPDFEPQSSRRTQRSNQIFFNHGFHGEHGGLGQPAYPCTP